MIPAIFPLPFDGTGVLASNRVHLELHNLGFHYALKYRCLTLDKGFFYTKSLELVDISGYKLGKGDYVCIGLSKEACKETGEEVCGVILIINPMVDAEIYVSASMVGGTYCRLGSLIEELVSTLNTGSKAPKWRNITNKPETFRPSGHMHAMWDLYGFENHLQALDTVAANIRNKNIIEYKKIKDEFENKIADLSQDYGELMAKLNAHIATTNAHGTSKAVLGLDKVNNQPILDYVDNTSTITTWRYLTPALITKILNDRFLGPLNTHISTQDAHQVTPAQIGSYSKAEIDSLINKRLSKTGTAWSSHKAYGQDWDTLYTSQRSSINANKITSGLLDHYRYSNQTNVSYRHVYVGQNQLADIRDIINKYIIHSTRVVTYNASSYRVDTTALTMLNMIFADISEYPLGTIAIYSAIHYTSWFRGNGANTANAVVTTVAIKKQTGFAYL